MSAILEYDVHKQEERMRTSLCVFAVLFISTCVKENKEKESCATESTASYEVPAELNGKTEAIGKIEVGGCFIKVKNYGKVELLSGLFVGWADEDKNKAGLEIVVRMHKQAVKQNIFFKNSCVFTVAYLGPDGQLHRFPEEHPCQEMKENKKMISR